MWKNKIFHEIFLGIKTLIETVKKVLTKDSLKVFGKGVVNFAEKTVPGFKVIKLIIEFIIKNSPTVIDFLKKIVSKA